MDNIYFAPLVSIVHLHYYALILGILVIHSLVDPELEPFNSPCWLQFGVGWKRPLNTLLFCFFDGVKLHYHS